MTIENLYAVYRIISQLELGTGNWLSIVYKVILLSVFIDYFEKLTFLKMYFNAIKEFNYLKLLSFLFLNF